MSLSGDMIVMRNGRSTSEVSVYNYPEHLNPFYEDDQHKRLRFWHINKKNNNYNEGRRSSFSNALKDMWAFKSFRLKKKSSTLGINKTSESPPPLRRDFHYSSTNNGAYTFDPRQRLTTDGSGARASLDNNFQRNALYRSSLQTMNSGQGLGFNRNDQYRSTIQTAGAGKSPQQALAVPGQSRRYVYAGSVTPQPLRNAEYRSGDSNETLTRGISQNSVNSTNPFDDGDEANETISIGDRSSTSLSPNRSAQHRRKRRAPPPPPPTHGMNNDSHNLSTESSQAPKSTEVSTVLHINETDDLQIQENLEISNLTAEIENFVKTVSDSPPEREQSTTARKETQNEPVAAVSNTNAVVVIKSEKVPAKIVAQKDVASVDAESIKSNSKTIKETKVSKDVPSKTSIKITKQIIEERVITKETPANANVAITETKQLESNVIPKPVEEHIASRHTHSKIEHQASTPAVVLRKSVKTEKQPEIGHMECIHVHIDRTETIPEDIDSRTSSFKAQPRPNIKPILKPKPEVKKLANLPSPNRERRALEQTEESTVELRNGGVTTVTTKTTSVGPLRIDETPPATPVKSQPANTISTTARAEDSASITTTTIRTTTETPAKATPLKSVKQQTTLAPAPAPLKIIEPEENILDSSNITITTQSATTNNNTIITTTPSTGMSPTIRTMNGVLPKTSSQFEWKQSTLAPLEPNIPPEKRKSVKDIIASINRSQRLLNAAAHREPQVSLTILPENSPLGGRYNEFITASPSSADTITTPPQLRKFSEPNNVYKTHQFNVNQHPVDSRLFNHATEDVATAAAPPSYEESQKLDNAEILRKCQVNKQVYDYRESSPTTSNLDWNPVPKPKRTKNLPEL